MDVQLLNIALLIDKNMYRVSQIKLPPHYYDGNTREFNSQYGIEGFTRLFFEKIVAKLFFTKDTGLLKFLKDSFQIFECFTCTNNQVFKIGKI
ncbi:unnamed protein product [Acanthoscelides obtectus]|uniref:Uncharacterized protein n=1 Tax=Acanthoscelides obtectus TaxID=200917 RepID=A0A9P0PKL4_ACAOB|nr:unnamed protein product [Acanthoscelides obtectus]CAK1675182.1 hypothetical protein AOBTE_LOCUS30041 [Acanthoscelides obtectus]